MVKDMMASFGPEQISKMFEGFQVPGLDMRAVMESQRKNVEALSQATQRAAQGATEVAQKQAEILRTAVTQAMTVATSLKAGDAAGTAQAQQDFVKQAFEAAVANAKELAEMIARSNREAYAVVEQRMKDSLEELRTVAQGKGMHG